MNATVNDINISYPDLGFAFNPIRIFIDNLILSGSVTLTAAGITIEREPYEGQTKVSFELSGIAKSLFDRLEFYKVQEQDTTLLKTLDFQLTFSDSSTYNGSIPILWGALQIGETYTQNKTLTYFKGFPFTVPLYVTENVILKVNDTEFKTLTAGKYNLSISDVASGNKIVISVFDNMLYKIFDFTFDSTFGPQQVLVPNGFNITVNIVDCPNDGVYLRWINKYAEYCYYLFQTNNQSITTKNDEIAYNNVFYTTGFTDNYHQGTGKSIGKNVEQTNKLFTSLVDSNTFDLLLSLVESPVVDVFAGYDTGNNPKWISVSVAEGTFAKSTADLQDFELFIIPNNRQIQTL